MLGRVGMKMELPAGYENITYYGRGPEENYVDRKTGSPIGVYDNTVDGMFVPYLKPQENGNRTDVRWVSLTDEAGDGILFSTDTPMEFGALHYSASELNSKAHPYQLTRADQVYLTLDYMQTGLGNGSCGPTMLEKYKVLSNRQYSFTYRCVRSPVRRIPSNRRWSRHKRRSSPRRSTASRWTAAPCPISRWTSTSTPSPI